MIKIFLKFYSSPITFIAIVLNSALLSHIKMLEAMNSKYQVLACLSVPPQPMVLSAADHTPFELQ